MRARRHIDAALVGLSWFCLACSAAKAGLPVPVQEPSGADLSTLLKAQTQAFSEAGLKGDAATLGRYLDPAVVFTNETGEKVTRQQIVESALPATGQPRIEVTDWTLVPQGDVASATFVDVLTQKLGDQTLVYRYHSTEVWAKRPDGWKMIASQTMVVPEDPPSIRLPAAQLDDYVGLYQTGPDLTVQIIRTGEELESRINGGAPRSLKVELRDVLFTPGTAPGRRLFQRDAAGRVTGYIARRNGNDQVFHRMG